MTHAGGEATAAHGAVSGWGAPFDAASLAVGRRSVWPSDPYGDVW
jgi:hypothetical protein